MEADPPTYRSYYPLQQGLRLAVIDIVLDFQLDAQFADFRIDLRRVLAAFRRRIRRPIRLEANYQVQVLSSLFYRDQTAYAVGRVLNGMDSMPFAVAMKHAEVAAVVHRRHASRRD